MNVKKKIASDLQAILPNKPRHRTLCLSGPSPRKLMSLQRFETWKEFLSFHGAVVGIYTSHREIPTLQSVIQIFRKLIFSYELTNKIIEPVNKLSLKHATLKLRFELSARAKENSVFLFFHKFIGSCL